MTRASRIRHDLIWHNMTSNIKQTLTDARLTYLQQEADNRGFYDKIIKK